MMNDWYSRNSESEDLKSKSDDMQKARERYIAVYQRYELVKEELKVEKQIAIEVLGIMRFHVLHTELKEKKGAIK